MSSVAKEYNNGQYTTDDIDAYIEERNEKMEQAGLQTVMDEVQRQIDEWRASAE